MTTKRLGLVFVLGCALLLFANLTPANAQTFCYHLTNFCDQVQLTKDGYGGWIGVWDWTCNGIDLTSIAGKGAHLATRPVSGGVPNAVTERFRFFKAFGVFDLFATDGFTITVYQWDQPWSKTVGPCVFPKPGAQPTKPRSTEAVQK